MILREHMLPYEDELRRHQRNDILIRDILPYSDSPAAIAYCKNNPILYCDSIGMSGKISIYCAGVNRARTSKDEGQFRYEANREVAWGSATNSYSGRTISAFLQTLRDVTAAEGDIEYLSIYSHSGSMYLFLDNGQYGKEAISNKSLNPSWDKYELTDLINAPDIKFSSNALVVFAGCNAGKTESEGSSIYSIAKDFTEQSGVASIGATNSTYPSSMKEKIIFNKNICFLLMVVLFFSCSSYKKVINNQINENEYDIKMLKACELYVESYQPLYYLNGDTFSMGRFNRIPDSINNYLLQCSVNNDFKALKYAYAIILRQSKEIEEIVTTPLVEHFIEFHPNGFVELFLKAMGRKNLEEVEDNVFDPLFFFDLCEWAEKNKKMIIDFGYIKKYKKKLKAITIAATDL